MISARRRIHHKVSLARALSKFGVTSRSKARTLIEAGKVHVNNRIVRSPEFRVDLRADRLSVKDRLIRAHRHVYLALNKPAGVVTTRSDELGRTTVYEFLPKNSGWLFPVGRLDKDTSGLLLVTNDTRFGEKVTNPLGRIQKKYSVRLGAPLRDSDRVMMEKSVALADGITLLPSVVRVSGSNPAVCTITICEGKNRQIRRMCEHFGYTVLALCRLSIGPIQLGRLREGATRPLTPDEVSAILSFAGE